MPLEALWQRNPKKDSENIIGNQVSRNSQTFGISGKTNLQCLEVGSWQAVMVHAFNHSTWEAEKRGSSQTKANIGERTTQEILSQKTHPNFFPKKFKGDRHGGTHL